MTILERLRTGAPRLRQSAPATIETNAISAGASEVHRTVPPFALSPEPANLAEFFHEQAVTEQLEPPSTPPAPVEALTTAPAILKLTPNHEAEQLAAWIVKEIERRFREGVVVIAGECIADGLDTERINVTVEHEAFRMLTKSSKRRTVLHRYVTQKLVQTKRDLYVQHHLPYSLADQFQYYRIIDAETGAFTEPVGFLVVEQFDVENGRPQSHPPQRFYYPLISSETIIGRNESEALRDGALTPGVGYVELPSVEGLSVCHLSLSAEPDGLTFCGRYLGNRENRSFHFHDGEVLADRVTVTGPIVYGPSADRPYVRFHVFSARLPEDSRKSNQAAPEMETLPDIGELLTAVEDGQAGEIADGHEETPAPRTPPRSVFLSPSLDATVPLIVTLPGRHGTRTAPAAPLTHSLLGLAVYIRNDADTDYRVVFQEIYPLASSRVVVGRRPRAEESEPEAQQVTLRFGDALREVNRAISRTHFMLEFRDGQVLGRQMSNRNHVFVLSNGQRLPLSAERLESLPSRTLVVEGRLADSESDVRLVFEIVDTDEG